MTKRTPGVGLWVAALLVASGALLGGGCREEKTAAPQAADGAGTREPARSAHHPLGEWPKSASLAASPLKRTASPLGSGFRVVLHTEFPGQQLPTYISVAKAQSPFNALFPKQVAQVAVSPEGLAASGPLEPGLYTLIGVNMKARGRYPVPHSVHAAVYVGENEIVDLGEETIAPDGALLKGKVVDLNGWPVSGATVFSPDTMSNEERSPGEQHFGYGETRTDEHGEFCLRHLPSDEGFIFARKDGYHLGGVLAAPGYGPARIVMCPTTQRAPWADQHVPRTPALSPEQRHRLAVDMVANSKPGNRDRGDWLAWYGALAILDPAVALAKAAEITYSDMGDVRAMAARELSATDPAAAMAALKANSTGPCWEAQTNLGLAVAKDHPEIAREAIREGDPAASSRLHYALGDKETARRLAMEAIRPLEKHPQVQVSPQVAMALAPFDLARARWLLNGHMCQDPPGSARQFALVILAQNPETALDVLRKEGSVDRGGDDFRATLLFRLGIVSPAFAIRYLPEACAGCHQDTALAIMVAAAAGAARSDPSVALSIVDLIEDMAAQPAGARDPYGYYDADPGASLAAAAIISGLCGGPDPRALMLRALATGRAKYSGAWDFARDTKAAMLASMVDRDLARWLLQTPEHAGVAPISVAKALVTTPEEGAAALLALNGTTDERYMSALSILTARPERRVEKALAVLGYTKNRLEDDTWLEWGP